MSKKGYCVCNIWIKTNNVCFIFSVRGLVQNKNCTFLGNARKPNEVRSRSQRLFSSRLLLLYISNHIHNDSLTTQIKVLGCCECGLDTTLTRCSGHLFWTQTLSQRAAVNALKNQNLTQDLLMVRHLSFVFKT